MINGQRLVHVVRGMLADGMNNWSWNVHIAMNGGQMTWIIQG